MQGLPQRNLHQFILWKMASSRMLVLQVREWMQIWGKVLSHASPGWRTAQQEVSKEWWQKCSGCAEEYTTFRCVFQDMEPPKFSSILRKSSDIRKPSRCVQFTKAVLRHANIRDQNPSLGMICPGVPHQRNPNAPKFEDRFEEETERQERCAREAAWKLAKSVLKLKEKNKAAFFSPSENRCLPASTLKLEERKFVVDSGASMHMISKKDLSDAEMETLTTSISPTIVMTANGEVQTHEEATVYVKELDIFLTMKVLENTPAVLSLGKLCDEHGYSYEWINGQKPGLIKNGVRIQGNTENFVPIVVPGLSSNSSTSFPSSTSMTLSRQEIDHPTSSSSSSTLPTMTVSSDSETRARRDLRGIDSYPASVSSKHVDRKEWRDPLTKPTKNTKPSKNEDHDLERWDPLYSDIPEWLQEFRENLVDDRVPEQRYSHVSSSHEPSSEPTSTRSVDLGKHSNYTHFPKDRNCEICQRTKITSAPCRRRTGGAVPRAKKFGDLITADHKVLSDNCESRNNHRCAVVVQDLATQWIQAYPCKNKTSQETQKSLQKFLEPERNPKVIYTANSLEFCKACEDLSWNHCTSTPHRSETNGIAERAVRRVKEGTSAVLLQSGLNESWWADSMEWYTYQRNVTDLLSDGKTPYERRFGEPFKGPIIRFGSLVEYYPISAKDQSWIHQFGKKVLPGLFLGYALYAGGIWKGDIMVADIEELETSSSSHEVSLEPTSKRFFSLPERPKLRDLPEDENHKGPVQKTHWRSRTSCRKFWWLDNSRSQSSLWKLWISKQSPICSRGAGLDHCKTKTSQVTQKSLQKFLEPDRKPKVIYTDNSLEFGKACEDLPWNHCTSTPHRSETNGIAERAVRRVKEGTSAVLLQLGLNESWWEDSLECYTYLRNVTDLLSDGKTPYERRFGQPFKGPIIRFGSLVEFYPISAKDQSRIHQFDKKVLPGIFLGYALYAGGIWKGDIMVADVEDLETMDAWNLLKKTQVQRK